MSTQTASIPRRVILPDTELPERFVNLKPHLETLPGPPLHPATREPVGPADLAPLFPEAFIAEEVAVEDVCIPEEVREAYRAFRPTPLVHAAGLERALQTPARIFFKYEGASPTGSHKTNTALMQAYHAKRAGASRLVTETGAGQWGSALSFAGAVFGLEVKVYMVRVSYDQKPGRKALIQSFGGVVTPSPSLETEPGRAALAEDPSSPGSLGLAISEAVADAVGRDDTFYSLGSVLDAVLLHQSVIGQEARRQMERAGFEPDVIIGCVGGGSNFAGLAFPFVIEALCGGKSVRFVAVESDAAPSLTAGEYRHDHGDSAGLTPLLRMHTLGHRFVPRPVHAGGLRYHGMAPLVSTLVDQGLVEARAVGQKEAFEAGVLFARAEGILPAPESCHAVKAAVDEALDAREEGRERVILFNLSGHGFFDTSGYEAFLAGGLT